MEKAMTTRIENQQITETVSFHGLVSGAQMGTWQADYQLTALDFEHLKNGKPSTVVWTQSILLVTAGFALGIAGKASAKFFGAPQEIFLGEWIAIAIGGFVSAILFVAGLFLPNEKKRVMSEIDNHFENAPKKRQLVQGEGK